MQKTFLTATAGLCALVTACSEPTSENLATVARSGKYTDLTETPDLAVYAKTADLAVYAKSTDLTGLAKSSELSPVAASGSYADLTNKPDLDVYATKAGLSLAAVSGDYEDLINTPDLSMYAPIAGLSAAAFSGDYGDLANSPDLSVYAPIADLSAAAFSGSYNDLTGTPDLTPYAKTAALSAYATNESLAAYAQTASLSPVAASGSYADLSDQPWTGDATAITTGAAVSIDGLGHNPLDVLTRDYSSVARDQASDHDGVAYPADTSNWQSFTAGTSGLLTRVDVNRWWDGPSTGYTLNIREGEGTAGNVIHTETGLTLADGFHPIELASGVRLTKGQVYTWELTNATSFILIGYNWATYTGGRGSYTPVQDMDFQFATYMQPDDGVPVSTLTVAQGGKVGVGTNAPTAKLDVAGDLRIRASRSPASTDACDQGQIAWDADYVYVCVAANTWRRSGLAAY